VYGGRCHGSGFIVLMEVVPNARCGITCGHLYLDLVEKMGWMPVQLTVDGGTETKYMKDLHDFLRAKFIPGPAPGVVALKSTDNLPIEFIWSYFLQFTGHDLKATILSGKSENLINIGLELDILLFQWLWSKIVKTAMDNFVKYWNHHKTRNKKEKCLPSGVSPREVFHNPTNFGLQRAGAEVTKEVVDELRAMLPKTREECMRWVPEEFDVRAAGVYDQLGKPKLTISSGWDTYTRMLSLL
ncbi:hypothetical protein FB45DRAFT_710743, partial [Roridomyces roridus]